MLVVELEGVPGTVRAEDASHIERGPKAEWVDPVDDLPVDIVDIEEHADIEDGRRTHVPHVDDAPSKMGIDLRFVEPRGDARCLDTLALSLIKPALSDLAS